MEKVRAGTDGKNRLKGFLILLFTLFLGLFIAWFGNMYTVDKKFEGLKIDLLSPDDNRAVTGNVSLKKESFSKGGHDTSLVWLDGEEHLIPFTVEKPRALRIRMSLYLPERKEGNGVDIYINGVHSGTVFPKWKGRFEKLGFDASLSALKRGINTLSFSTGGVRAGYESITARDIAGYNKRFPRVSVLFDENIDLRNRHARAPLDYVLFPAAAFIIWIFTANLIRHNRSIEIPEASGRLLALYLPTIFVFTGCAIFSGLTKYDIAFYPETFYLLALAPGLFALGYNAARAALFTRALKRKEKCAESKPGKHVIPALRFIYRNSGTIAVAGFMLFLSLAGVFLMFKQQETADRLGDAAFFSLLFAVIVRTLELKGGKEGE